ncbi:DUF6326 family protein [Wenyingzhuangia sp. IMCC45574]
MKKRTLSTEMKLSLLWIVVLFNMVFADVFSLVIEIVKGGVFEIPLQVTTMMAIAAILTNFSILMIYLSNTLPYKVNRKVNIIVGIFTLFYVVGGASILPHYIIMGGIEVLCLLTITIMAYNWKNETV